MSAPSPAYRPRVAGRPRREISPAIDARIADAYRCYRLKNDRNAIKAAAAELGWKRHWVVRRGRELGLARTKEAPWSPAEEAIMRRWSHVVDVAIQAKLREVGFRRTLTAVHLKASRLRIRKDASGYSATRLAAALSVDTHKVMRWIEVGVLKAERRGTARTQAQGGDEWHIEEESVREFIVQFPEEIDLYKLDKFWFLNVLTRGEVYR